MSKGQVGIIGLGIMGGAIAKNLSSAGWHVIGFDIEKARCDEAKAAGVEIASDAAAVAARRSRHAFFRARRPALTASGL